MRAAADFFFSSSRFGVRFSSYVCGWLLGPIFWHGELLSDVPRARQRKLTWRTIELSLAHSYKAKATPASGRVKCSKLVQFAGECKKSLRMETKIKVEKISAITLRVTICGPLFGSIGTFSAWSLCTVERMHISRRSA